MILLLLISHLLFVYAQSDNECEKIMCDPQNSNAKCVEFPDQQCIHGESDLYYCCEPEINSEIGSNLTSTMSSLVYSTTWKPTIGTRTSYSKSTTDPKGGKEDDLIARNSTFVGNNEGIPVSTPSRPPTTSSSFYNSKSSTKSTTKLPTTTALPSKTSSNLPLRSTTISSTPSASTTTKTTQPSRPTTKVGTTSNLPSTMTFYSSTLSSTSTTTTTSLTSTTTTKAEKKECEPGWTSWNGNCYFVGHGDSVLTGEDAEFKCNFMDAELTDISTPEELQFLGDLAKPGGTGYLFIGLKRINGQFLYKNGTSIGYIQWCSNEPNGPIGTQHTCGFLELTKNGPCVGDNYCYNKLPRYICKKEESVPSTKCEPGWKFWNGNCYLFGKSAEIDAVDAETVCKSKGAEITDINSEDELDFVGRLIKGNDGGAFPLIGLKRINDRFLYKNQTSIGYIRWCRWEPNQPYRKNLCSYIKYKDVPNYCIADADCLGFSSYVCKKEHFR